MTSQETMPNQKDAPDDRFEEVEQRLENLELEFRLLNKYLYEHLPADDSAPL
jgi:hypothetical protein